MKLMNSLRSLGFALVLLSSTAAHAALIQFNLTGDYTASWQLDTSIPPYDPLTGIWVTYIDVPGSFPGASTGVVDMTFYTPVLQGGFEIYDYNADVALVETIGPQLYTGPEESPTFLLGTFALTEIDGPGNYLLTISEVAEAAVPEPATGVLVMGGLALMGASMRRKAVRKS